MPNHSFGRAANSQLETLKALPSAPFPSPSGGSGSVLNSQRGKGTVLTVPGQAPREWFQPLRECPQGLKPIPFPPCSAWLKPCPYSTWRHYSSGQTGDESATACYHGSLVW